MYILYTVKHTIRLLNNVYACVHVAIVTHQVIMSIRVGTQLHWPYYNPPRVLFMYVYDESLWQHAHMHNVCA